MSYECRICGARLDPGELCSCRRPEEPGTALRVIRRPVISEELDSVKHRLDAVIADVRQLQADDSSLKQVKAIRAELAKQFQAMEQQRKAAKQQVLEPYLQAEAKYKKAITEPYQAADRELKEWVDNYQDGLKQEKEQALRRFFEALCQAQGVDFLRFEQAGITVDMAMARQKEARKAQDTLDAFVRKVRQEVDTIAGLEDGAAVLAEYRQSLDLTGAICTVKQRKRRQQEMERQLQKAQEARQQEQQHRKALLEASPELARAMEDKEILTMTFTVSGSREALKGLKAYIMSSELVVEG